MAQGPRASAGQDILRGRQTGTRPRRPLDSSLSLDLNASLSAAAVRQIIAGDPVGRLQPLPEDLQQRVFQKTRHRLVVLAVDLSDSMGDGPSSRMSAALGTALALARHSYLNRDQVSLITFRDQTARVVIPPTGSVALVRRKLGRLPVGGATPLADGLGTALRVIRQSQGKQPGIEPLLVIISDGEATAAMHPGGDPVREALEAAKKIHQADIPVVLIDTSTGAQTASLMPQLTKIFATRRHRLHALTAGQVLELIDPPQQDQTT